MSLCREAGGGGGEGADLWAPLMFSCPVTRVALLIGIYQGPETFWDLDQGSLSGGRLRKREQSLRPFNFNLKGKSKAGI